MDLGRSLDAEACKAALAVSQAPNRPPDPNLPPATSCPAFLVRRACNQCARSRRRCRRRVGTHRSHRTNKKKKETNTNSNTYTRAGTQTLKQCIGLHKLHCSSQQQQRQQQRAVKIETLQYGAAVTEVT